MLCYVNHFTSLGQVVFATTFPKLALPVIGDKCAVCHIKVSATEFGLAQEHSQAFLY